MAINKKIIITIIIVIVVLFVCFLIRGPEDTWLCENGQWVKHGNPSALMPTEPCGQEEIKDFDDCLGAGYPVLENYPRQCKTAGG